VGAERHRVRWHRSPADHEKPAWTWRGQAVPFAAIQLPRDPASAEPLSLTPLHLRAIADRSTIARAAIACEKIAGPVLLVSAGDDALWPSELLSELAMERMQTRGHRFPHVHLRNPGAGHLFGIPNGPVTTRSLVQPLARVHIAFGGSAAADARACRDSWRATLAFLTEHVPPRRAGR